MKDGRGGGIGFAGSALTALAHFGLGVDSTAQKPLPAPVGAEELFRRHAPFVAAFVRRMGLGGDIDDVVQETFLVAHRHGGYRPGPATPKSWLASIALRVATTRRRSSQRRRERERAAGALVAPSDHDGPDRAAERRAMVQRVQSALATLDEDKRAVFVLFELEGESCTAIAASMDLPTGTVYSRLHHARKAFIKAMNERLTRDGGSPA